MRGLCRTALIAATALAGSNAFAREVCQERTLSLRYSPQAGQSWCWAASGQMVMELLGLDRKSACQCRQAEQVLGVAGCCATPGSCVPVAAAARCDAARWPAFVERADLFQFEYRTTCDALSKRHDDESCDAMPLPWHELSAEICAGRPVLAALRPRGSLQGHLVVVKGVSIHGGNRVLVVDPKRLCPNGRACEGELDEGFWLSYEEYAAGWDGLVHWVDFYGIRRKGRAGVESPRRRTSCARQVQ
jgi:hypothetical protein